MIDHSPCAMLGAEFAAKAPADVTVADTENAGLFCARSSTAFADEIEFAPDRPQRPDPASGRRTSPRFEPDPTTRLHVFRQPESRFRSHRCRWRAAAPARGAHQPTRPGQGHAFVAPVFPGHECRGQHRADGCDRFRQESAAAQPGHVRPGGRWRDFSQRRKSHGAEHARPSLACRLRAPAAGHDRRHGRAKPAATVHTCHSCRATLRPGPGVASAGCSGTARRLSRQAGARSVGWGSAVGRADSRAAARPADPAAG